jgi:circadian clock protein KaiC
MNAKTKVKINRLPTGVPGLDEILGDGLPEFSLAHQFIFANATVERPALYFTVLGEPALKMLRYQQQFTFFDAAKLNNAVRFVNLSQELVERGLQGVLEEISRQVEAANPSIVVVDSFRTVLRSEVHESKEMAVQTFVQQLALLLTSWEATTLLVGEYSELELRDNPVFTVADGLFWLFQQVDRNSVVRKMQIMKLRGQLRYLACTPSALPRLDWRPSRAHLACWVKERPLPLASAFRWVFRPWTR